MTSKVAAGATLLLFCLLGIASTARAQEPVPQAVEKSVTAWVRTLEAPYAGLGEAVISAQGELVIRSGRYVTAYDCATGEYLWKFEVGDLPLEFHPHIADTVKGGEEIFIMAMQPGILGEQGAVYCLDAATHKVVWNKDCDGLNPEFACAGKLLAYQSVDRLDRVIVVRSRGGFGAYDEDIDNYYRNFVPAGDLILADLGGDKLYALDLNNKARPAWEYRTRGALRSPAVVDGGFAYLVDGDGTLHCIDLAKKSAAWTAPVGGKGTIEPVVDGDTVYAVSTEGRLSALDTANGRRRWLLDTGGRPYAAPGVGRGGLIVPLDGGRALAVDKRRGEATWSLQVEDFEFTIPCAANKDIVYLLGNRKGGSRILAVDTRTVTRGFDIVVPDPVIVDPVVQPGVDPVADAGQPGFAALYSLEFNGLHKGASTPLVDGDRVYCVAGSFLHAFDGEGREAWSTGFETLEYTKARLFDGGEVLISLAPVRVTLREGWQVCAWRKRDGRKLWDAVYEDIHPFAELRNGDLYLATNHRKAGHEFSRRNLVTGEVKWEINTGDLLLAYPRLVGDTVVCAAGDKLLALAADSGVVQWQMGLNAEPVAPPAFAGLNLVMVERNGGLLRVNLNDRSRVDRLALPFKAEGLSEPLNDSLLVFGRGGEISRFDPATGELLWTAAITGPLAAAPQWTASATVVAIEQGGPRAAGHVRELGALHLLDAANGRILQTVELGYRPGDDAVAIGGNVLAATANDADRSYLYAWNCTLGAGDPVVQPVDPGPGVESGAGPGESISLEEVRNRLANLKSLFEEGLIPEDVYKTKVREVLDKYLE